MKALKILGIIVGVIVLLGFGAATLLGYVPAVSNLIGLNKPKDLGVKYTQADLDNGRTKFGTELATISDTGNPATSIRYEGEATINASFTSAEVTALVNNNDWEYMPVKDVQVKFNNDGSAEASGVLRLNVLPSYFEGTGTASAGTAEALNYVKFLPAEAPFYISGTASVTNNTVTINPVRTEISLGSLFATTTYAAGNTATSNVTSFRAGSFNIAQSILDKYQSQISAFLTARINAIPNTKLNGSFAGGNLNLKGTLPAKKFTVNE